LPVLFALTAVLMTWKTLYPFDFFGAALCFPQLPGA
jgi:hypothetical protein